MITITLQITSNLTVVQQHVLASNKEKYQSSVSLVPCEQNPHPLWILLTKGQQLEMFSMAWHDIIMQNSYPSTCWKERVYIIVKEPGVHYVDGFDLIPDYINMNNHCQNGIYHGEQNAVLCNSCHTQPLKNIHLHVDKISAHINVSFSPWERNVLITLKVLSQIYFYEY